MINTLLFASVIYISHPPPDRLSDSTQNVSNKKVTLRLHSAGVFAYSGRIVTTNPVADINFTYERKVWGYTLYKAADLFNSNTQINFMLTGVYSNLKVSKHLTITPYLALRLEQNRSFADKGSDLIFITTTSFRIHSNWIIDYTSILANIMLERKDMDWTNRFRLLFSNHHVDGGLMIWNNTKILDSDDFVSTGLNLTYARINISTHFQMNLGVTGILMVNTSDENEFPKRNGIVFSVSSTWH